MTKPQLNDCFYIKTSPDRMSASLYCKKSYHPESVHLNKTVVHEFLHENNIVYGINEQSIQDLITLKPDEFPITIAKGSPPQHGEDGYLTYEANLSSDIQRTSDWNFREVMRIPSVKEGDKLATIVMPTKGTAGTNVFGQQVPARAGQKVPIQAGKNVEFKENDNSFYATIEGQISVNDRYIEVHPVYEVNETLSMKTGNLHFVGSIIIRGDVPTGYSVKAEGDIKIFGIVEAATVKAGGSIFISEGFAGLQKGRIQAADDIHIGYINQGFAQAGHSIHVENSIIHSTCIARQRVFCQQGNIIGGSLSAGQSIEAKDVGNRLSTKTEINLGINKAVDQKEQKLLQEKEDLQATLEKLELIGKKLRRKQHQQDPNTRITLLRQRRSIEKTNEQLKKVEHQLLQMNSFLGSEHEAILKVRNNLYPNVIVSFGKYKRNVQSTHQHVHVKLDSHEIVVQSL